jgi:hypothetical protein
MNPLADGSCDDCHVHSGMATQIESAHRRIDGAHDRIGGSVRNGLVVIGLCLTLVMCMFGWVAMEIRTVNESVSEVREAVAAHVGRETSKLQILQGARE